jgi:DNA primase
MGSSLSKTQEALLAVRVKRVALMFDGDEAGRKGTRECLDRLTSQTWVRAVMLSEGRQPDRISIEEIQKLFSTQPTAEKRGG